MSEENKVVIPKPAGRGGFDMSFNNLETFTSVKIKRTSVTGKMYNKFSSYFVTIKDRVNEGEVLQMGVFKYLYKVVKVVKITTKGPLLKVKRLDGVNMTQHDIDSINLDSVVIIKNRKSFDKLFEDFSIFDKE